MDTMRPLYEKAVAEAKAADTPEKRRGVGIAWGGFNVTEGTTDSAEVALELGADGRIWKYDTWHNMGQGGDVGSLMVTLEALKELHITPEDVQLVQNDTKLCPDTGMAGASRSFYMDGNATKIAAEKLLNNMRNPDGTFRTYEEMKAEGIETKYLGRYETTTTPGLTRLTTVLKFTCVDMVGRVGNIDAVNGQAYGGISHSIGFALKEDYQDVKKHANMFGAGVSYIKDITDDINVIHMPVTIEDGPFGSSGASEAFQASGHVAVLNGIARACGVRIHEMPALPAKVKAGLDAIAAGKEPEAPKKYFLGSDMYEELENIKENPVQYDSYNFYQPLGDADADRPF